MLEQTNNPLLIDNRHEIIRIIHSLFIAHKRRLLPWLQAPASLRITGFFVNQSRTRLPHFPLQKQSELYILIIAVGWRGVGKISEL